VSAHSAHLKDDCLFECYLAGCTGEALDPRSADHLSSCTECSARYAELRVFMERLSDQAEAETDIEFPAGRLAVQHQQILRRIELVNRSARVITFPGRELASDSHPGIRLTPRWLAAAAAAGLFIGVAVGGYLTPARLHRSASVQPNAVPSMAVQRPAPNASVLVSGTQSADAPDDDTFLMELELALARPHTRELQPFDAMTPHIQDVDNRTR